MIPSNHLKSGKTTLRRVSLHLGFLLFSTSGRDRGLLPVARFGQLDNEHKSLDHEEADGDCCWRGVNIPGVRPIGSERKRSRSEVRAQRRSDIRQGKGGTDPSVKQMENAIPTSASDFDRVSEVVTSEMIALSGQTVTVVRLTCSTAHCLRSSPQQDVTAGR